MDLLYEIASIKGGVAKRIKVKDAFECVEITGTHVVLRYLTQEEVIQRLGEERTDVIAVNLVHQFLQNCYQGPSSEADPTFQNSVDKK